jgi:hypothetical protein
MPVLMWSLSEGGVVSPAVSQSRLPPQAVGQRAPEVEAGRAREPEVEVALVGVAELIDAERIPVDDQRVGQVVADRVEVAPVLLGVDEVPVELVEPEDEAADLEGRDGVAPALAGLPVELFTLRPGERRREESQDQYNDERECHAPAADCRHDQEEAEPCNSEAPRV